MCNNARNSHLSVLVVDPNPGMRATCRICSTRRITKIEYAVSSGTAIRQLARNRYDIILCEYDLGGSGENDGQDGQQLLEDLRHHKLIQPWTIFIMLTSEGVYSKVIGAAELHPDRLHPQALHRRLAAAAAAQARARATRRVPADLPADRGRQSARAIAALPIDGEENLASALRRRLRAPARRAAGAIGREQAESELSTR
jgi:CheY-like chemotaxis protein